MFLPFSVLASEDWWVVFCLPMLWLGWECRVLNMGS